MSEVIFFSKILGLDTQAKWIIADKILNDKKLAYLKRRP